MNRKEMLIQLRIEKKDPLAISIGKWQDIVDGKGIDEKANNCALCEVYMSHRRWFKCRGCPVCKYTNGCGCSKTPYIQFLYGFSSDAKATSAQKMLLLLKMIRAMETNDWDDIQINRGEQE